MSEAEAASGDAAESADAPSRGNTRSRIQSVAVELFGEQGYEKTSLREIAERLGVTKAALYYHYKSKEDIVHSLVDDYFGQVDALVAWGRQQPSTAQVRGELLARYLDIVIDGHEVYRMLHQNQAALGSLTSIKQRGELFRERMNSLIELFAGPDATLHDRVRAAMATSGLSIGWMVFHDQADDPGELRDVILNVAREVADCPAQGDDQPGRAGLRAAGGSVAGPAAAGPSAAAAAPAAAAHTRGSTR
jgi:AcrR family transcriptional regulator